VLEFSEVVTFVAATDLARAREFYEGVLGLPVERQARFASSFRAAGTTVRLTLVDDVEPAPYTVLGWSVPDIEDTVRTLMSRGVQFERFDDLDQNEWGIWEAVDGSQVAWFKDPDGNILSLTQA
jgi:catechol 2,3-dioxygenase-like lactoylglutathione lyase family enzyme